MNCLNVKIKKKKKTAMFLIVFKDKYQANSHRVGAQLKHLRFHFAPELLTLTVFYLALSLSFSFSPSTSHSPLSYSFIINIHGKICEIYFYHITQRVSLSFRTRWSRNTTAITGLSNRYFDFFETLLKLNQCPRLWMLQCLSTLSSIN